MLEARIEAAILRYLNAKLAYAGKFDASAVLKDRRAKKHITKVPIGWPDIAAYTFEGQLVLIEVKTPETYNAGLSYRQLVRLLHGIENGVLAFAADSVERVQTVIETYHTIADPIERKLYLVTLLPPKHKNLSKRVALSAPLIIPVKTELERQRFYGTANAVNQKANE